MYFNPFYPVLILLMCETLLSLNFSFWLIIQLLNTNQNEILSLFHIHVGSAALTKLNPNKPKQNKLIFAAEKVL